MTREDTVFFEAVLRSESGQSMFAKDTTLEAENLKQFTPVAGAGARAATALNGLGIRVRHIGTFSISGECSREKWEKEFGTKVEQKSQPISTAHPDLGEVKYWSHVAGVPFKVPAVLDGLVERAYPQAPPVLFESPLPPRVAYHHLRVPDDVATVLRADLVHKEGVTGKGVLVAMPDTGFYKHPFYAWHGYHYNRTLSPDATFLD